MSIYWCALLYKLRGINVGYFIHNRMEYTVYLVRLHNIFKPTDKTTEINYTYFY